MTPVPAAAALRRLEGRLRYWRRIGLTLVLARYPCDIEVPLGALVTTESAWREFERLRGMQGVSRAAREELGDFINRCLDGRGEG